MKADISLAERRQIEREQQAEIRAMLTPRHFAAMEAEQAISYYWFVHALQVGPALSETLARLGHSPVPVATPVVIPEPEPVAPLVPAPIAIPPSAPGVPFDLRQRLGLR